MKVIGYIRVSTRNQDLRRQEVKISDFCELKDYEIVKIIPDDGISGATNDREGYRELMSLSGEEAEMIVISELSRLSRKEDILSTLNDIQRLTERGFKLLFLDNPDKIYTGTLDLLEIVSLSFTAYGAAQERITTRKRNQEGKEVLFRRLPYSMVDGVIPYGYKKVPNPNIKHPKYFIEEVEEEATVLKKIFSLVMEGMSLSKIVHHLYNTGIRHSGETIFTKQYISKLIKNPIYKGERKRKTFVSEITPIIEAEIWDAVQVKLIDNKYYNSNGTTMFNPLKGILKCRCGRAMIVKQKYTNVHIYRCSQVQPSFLPNRCEYLDSIRYDFTNVTILSFLKGLNFVEVEGNGATRISEIKIEYKGIEEQVIHHREDLNELDKKIQKQYERFAEAEDRDLADFVQKQIESTKTEKSSLEKTISKKEKKIIQLKDQIRSIENFSRNEDFENLDIISQASLFRKYIKKIQYLPVTTMQGFYEIELTIGSKEYIAVRKTKRSPLVVKVPNGLHLNEDLTLSYTEYDRSNSRWLYDLSAVRNRTMKIQDYFKKYAEEDRLNVDLSYRDRIIQSESTNRRHR
jgi:site-specific DNA recombinase